MAEYRPVPEHRQNDRRALTGYAFDAGSGPPQPPDRDERLVRMWGFGEDRGMFEGDRLLACCTHIDFDARVRGTWLPLAGLTGVATAPERRREGLAGRMFEASLAEYRDRGWPVSALRPFEESVYARYGWATGTRYTTATVPPSALAPARETTGGRFRRVRPEAFERLEPVYREWLDGVGLATRRDDDWWRDRVFHTFRSELYCYAWERDGEPRGYLIYGIEDRELTVHEAAHTDGEAYLSLLRFLADHDAQIEEITLRGRDHERLLDVVEDRSALTVEVAPGYMVRIVDVPAALEAVPYPGVENVSLALAVADDHAPWNDRTFGVAVRDGTATVEPTDAAPDARVDVGTLSQLLVGYLPAERALTLGGLEAGPDTVGSLARLFPTEETYLPERF
jgi:predicted acetyltransferase